MPDVYSSVLIDGLPISPATPDAILAEMDRAIRERDRPRSISITNTESMYHGVRDAAHRAFLRRTDFSLCDGIGVVFAGWAWGHRIRRFNGPVLQLLATEYGQSRGWRHYFYGGKPGVADLMSERLKSRFPGIVVCGTHAPPMRPLTEQERRDVCENIRTSRPDIVWVGLGLRKQESWIAENIEEVGVPWMAGVGAAFDYHAGTVPWAPAPIRAVGLEWLFRLIIQPRLRAKRYWWSFVWMAQTLTKGLLTLQFLRPVWRFEPPIGWRSVEADAPGSSGRSA